jgi:hypothetical protein
VTCGGEKLPQLSPAFARYERRMSQLSSCLLTATACGILESFALARHSGMVSRGGESHSGSPNRLPFHGQLHGQRRGGEAHVGLRKRKSSGAKMLSSLRVREVGGGSHHGKGPHKSSRGACAAIMSLQMDHGQGGRTCNRRNPALPIHHLHAQRSLVTSCVPVLSWRPRGVGCLPRIWAPVWPES